MKIVVFDDDSRMAENSERIIKRVALETNVANLDISVFSNSVEFQKWLGENKADVAVLDISIAEDEDFGISCARQIRKNNKNAHIIFVTSNDGKISQIFTGMIRPTQFILKNTGNGELAAVMSEIFKEVSSGKKIKITYGRTEYFLSSEEIVCICKDGRKTSITLEERVIETTDSLASLDKKLGADFFWADKGTIINKRMIKEIIYPEKRIVMSNGQNIYMSRNSAKEIKKQFSDIG